MAVNLLRNGGFEADWGDERSHLCRVFPFEDGKGAYEKDVGNVFTPPGWVTWFRHEPGEWDQPEVRDARKSGDARRVHSGEKGMLLFTFHRKHRAGFLQRVEVERGARLRLTAWAHAWSNWQDGPHPDDGRWSDGEGVGYEPFFGLLGAVSDDNARNFAFAVGIDPTGGMNPFADSVVWGLGAHIYNEYAAVPEVEVVAQADVVTVFLRSETLWAFKHNDAYWDDVSLEVVGAPDPDPQPSREWKYPVIGKGSKLGVHAIFSNHVLEFAQALVDGGTHFPVVKAVDDLSWLVEVKRISPETITIGRLTDPPDTCGGVEKESFSLEQYADKHLGAILSKIAGDARLETAVDYWEVYNEPDPPGAAGHRRLAELMMVTMEMAESDGLKIAIFTFNSGCPEWDEMEAVVETGVFGVARAGGHILTTHEGPFGHNVPVDKDFGARIPGSPFVEGAGALCFRYRYLYHLMKARDEVVPLVITEWYGGTYQKDGSAADVVEQVRWWDSEAKKDYYLWAVCPFTLGPSRQWHAQDYEFAYQALVEYAVSVREQQNALPPVSSPPRPVRGAPREQYARTYVLLPPDANWVWPAVVAAATWDELRRTIGGGADDAGLGDLDDRDVVAVNPDRWPSDLWKFYERWYPGVWVRGIRAETPWEMGILLQDDLVGDYALGQRDESWAVKDMGEQPGGKTIGQEGCLLTAGCVVLQVVSGKVVHPPLLDRLLVIARAPYRNDNYLWFESFVELFPSFFDDSLRWDRQPTLGELKQLLAQGWLVVLARHDFKHYVVLDRLEREGELLVIDPWMGTRVLWSLGDVGGVRGAHRVKFEPPPEPVKTATVSLHVQGGQDGLAEFVNAVKPRAMKFVDQFELLHLVKSSSPDTLTVYRHWWSKEDQDKFVYHHDGPDAGARAAFAQIKDGLRKWRDDIDYVETPGNEALAGGKVEEIKASVAFDAAWGRLMREEGFRSCLLTVGVGNPGHGAETELLLPAAREADAIGYHAYWPSGPSGCFLDSHWREYAGRALTSWDETFQKHGVRVDYIASEGGPVGEGPWKLDGDWGWRHERCLDGDWARCLAEILRFDELAWESEPGAAGRYLGLCLFTIGQGFGWGKWEYREPQLRALMEALRR